MDVYERLCRAEMRAWFEGNIAKAIIAADNTVSWDLYPCEFMSVEETLDNFKQCMQGEPK
jgi:hypothetical protein